MALIGVEASAYAAPSDSASRTPSSGVEGTEYTVSCEVFWCYKKSDISVLVCGIILKVIFPKMVSVLMVP